MPVKVQHKTFYIKRHPDFFISGCLVILGGDFKKATFRFM